ncbi:MAG: NUDIX hydrolase [Candidatus Dojkabacteria bacterium]
MKTSAGIMLYKKENDILKVFLVHSGGPFWAKKDAGAWGIPKGLVEEGEDLKETAIREVGEELGQDINVDISKLVELGHVKQRSNKNVYAFSFLTDFGDIEVKSNTIYIEWPPKSGKQIEIPEVDKGEWFDIETAKIKIMSYQLPFLDFLVTSL